MYVKTMAIVDDKPDMVQKVDDIEVCDFEKPQEVSASKLISTQEQTPVISFQISHSPEISNNERQSPIISNDGGQSPSFLPPLVSDRRRG